MLCYRKIFKYVNIFFHMLNLYYRDISGPKSEWAMKMGQWPMSHSFAYKNKDFDGPFEILMDHLEKMMGLRNLNIQLTAK